MKKSTLREAAAKHPSLILPPYDEIIKNDGFDAICAFSEQLGGAAVYIPSTRTIFAECLLRQAESELEARCVTFAALARKYGFTERHLRKKLTGS